jgi:hypothetical protein
MIIITVESEVELQRMCDALTEKEIPFLVKRHNDSAFPSIAVGKPFAEISLEDSHHQVVQEISKGILGRDVLGVSPIPNTSKHKTWFKVVIVYSLLISIVAFRFWYLHHKSNTDKNFHFEWNYDGTQLSYFDKKTGQRSLLYLDENYNYNFEEIITYSDSGALATKSFDKNENGRHEWFYQYKPSGELVAKLIDHDDDGLFDEISIALQNGGHLTFIDKNKDGFFEMEEQK